jgi:hypothetical protein
MLFLRAVATPLQIVAGQDEAATEAGYGLWKLRRQHGHSPSNPCMSALNAVG